MKTLRNLTGLTFMVVYMLAGGATIEAAVDCDEWQTCEPPGVTYYWRECTWQNEPMTCDQVWNVMCAGYPFNGSGHNSFNCQDNFGEDERWLCDYYPGYCTSSGFGGCQTTGAYCP